MEDKRRFWGGKRKKKNIKGEKRKNKAKRRKFGL